MKKIYLGADHAGFELKERIKGWFRKNRVLYEDCGNLQYDLNDDYPDFAALVGKEVVQHKSKGILVCGSAEGVCIAANKVPGIRAVNPASKVQALFARRHEDVNILCLAGGKTRQPQPGISFSRAKERITTFLNTDFSGEERHRRRLAKIKQMEK